MKHIGENVVRIEAEALRALADRIAGPMAEAFVKAVELIYACSGRVVVTGMDLHFDASARNKGVF